MTIYQVGALLALSADSGLIVTTRKAGKLALLDTDVVGVESKAISTEGTSVVVASETFVRAGHALSIPELVALRAVEAVSYVLSSAVGTVY